jgi:hypothetical protein
MTGKMKAPPKGPGTQPPRPLRPEAFLEKARALLAAGKIEYSHHAISERMPERGIDVMDVEDVVRTGMISGPIEPGKTEGDWKAKIVGQPDGTSRRMGVVTVVARRGALVIVTTEWEDV